MNLSQLVASAPDILPPFVTGSCRNLPPVAVRFHFTLTFSYSLPRFLPNDLFWSVMSEMPKPKRGGRAYHSVLEPHFDFIRELRQRRKTWQEIAELLHSEKGVRVTFHAPYLFYRRKLKRAAKPHWENSPVDSQPAQPVATASRPQFRPSPLAKPVHFNRPNLSTTDTEAFT